MRLTLRPVFWVLLLFVGLVAPSRAEAQAINYFGFLDDADCTRATGWVYSPEQTATAQQVQIYVDGALATTVVANQFRPDVAAAGFGTGYYGFTWTYPAPYYGTHSVRARAVGAGTDLYWSPKTISCAAPAINYFGFLDDANCTRATGWVYSPEQPNSSQQVQLFVDGALAATVLANQFRPDVAAAGFGGGYAGFTWTYPSTMIGSHAVRARAVGAGTDLFWSPRTVSCASGGFDGATGTTDLRRTLVLGEAAETVVRMTNTGTTTWRAGRYTLRGDDGSTKTMLYDVGPGGTYPFTMTVTANAVGAHTKSWRMAVDGVEFGTPATSSLVVASLGGVYQVQASTGQVCSGTLIGARTLLTAAHCGTSAAIAYVGRPGQLLVTGRYVLYPGYSLAQYAGPVSWWAPDLAVVRLDAPLDGPRAAVRDSQAPVGGLTTAGWGRSFAHPGGNHLHFGQHTVSEVVGWHFSQRGVPVIDGRDDLTAIVCQGDSGGPVFVGQTPWTGLCVAGVNSYNIPAPGTSPPPDADLTPPQCVTGTWHAKIDRAWVLAVAQDPTILGC